MNSPNPQEWPDSRTELPEVFVQIGPGRRIGESLDSEAPAGRLYARDERSSPTSCLGGTNSGALGTRPSKAGCPASGRHAGCSRSYSRTGSRTTTPPRRSVRHAGRSLPMPRPRCTRRLELRPVARCYETPCHGPRHVRERENSHQAWRCAAGEESEGRNDGRAGASESAAAVSSSKPVPMLKYRVEP